MVLFLAAAILCIQRLRAVFLHQQLQELMFIPSVLLEEGSDMLGGTELGGIPLIDSVEASLDGHVD